MSPFHVEELSRLPLFVPESLVVLVIGWSYVRATAIMGTSPMLSHSSQELGSTIPSQWSMRTEFHSSSDLKGCPRSDISTAFRNPR